MTAATARAGHGLVIGKFYPPHAGHSLLIAAAAGACRRVTVLAMAASHESIALDKRVGWLRALHADQPHVTVIGIVDDLAVDYGSDAIWQGHVALMQQALAAIDAPVVDAVFSSEPYGAELAHRLGARPVTVDVARRWAPISATRFRGDPVGHWSFIGAPVRADLAWRIVVLGAESSGTTTLSLDLVDALRRRGGNHALTRWVPEYGREASLHKLVVAQALAQLADAPPPMLADIDWRTDDFTHIAQRQTALAAEQAAHGGPLLVCDTDAFATAIWHERYLGQPSPAVDAIAEADRGRLYLLTDPDGVPFEDDGLRDGESVRTWMHARFLERLQATGRRFTVVRGDRPARLQAALAAIDEELQRGWGFAAPFG